MKRRPQMIGAHVPPTEKKTPKNPQRETAREFNAAFDRWATGKHSHLAFAPATFTGVPIR